MFHVLTSRFASVHSFLQIVPVNNPILLELYFVVGQLLKAFMGHYLTSKAMAPVSEQLLPNITQQSTQSFKLLNKYAQLTLSQDFLMMAVKESVMVKKIMVVLAFYVYCFGTIKEALKNDIKTLTSVSVLVN